VADTNQYKNKSPAFSLSTRYNMPSDTSLKPGPGTYTPEKVNKISSTGEPSRLGSRAAEYEKINGE
jgi:hypothetical protein